jgi:multidrug resistance efflux pump
MHAFTINVTHDKLATLFALGAKYLELRLERAEARVRTAEAQRKATDYPVRDYNSPERALFEAQLERSEIAQQLAAFTWTQQAALSSGQSTFTLGIDDIDAIVHGEVARMRGLREVQ